MTVSDNNFGILVTECARKKIMLLSSQASRVLRVEVTSGGCQGKQYLFTMVDIDSSDIDPENDIMLASPMPLIIIDKQSLGALEGSILDYVESIQWTGFAIVSNPQAQSSCNCGSSFS